jgi:hypothetical protein
MAFNRYAAINIGTSASGIRTATSTDVIIGMRITNRTANLIKVSAYVTIGGTGDVYLVGGPTNGTMGADVPVGGSIVVISGDADKVVIKSGDVVNVVSSIASSADCVLSVLEAA